MRRGRRLVLAALAVFAAVLVLAPFEHHDLACHLKTPQHCSSCSSSQLGSDVAPLGTPGASRLVDAGAARSFDVLAEGALLPVRTTGRSPPTVA
jgi:hypothetical protein